MQLSDYTSDLYDLLHDQGGQFYSTVNIIRYINQARSKLAAETQCFRFLTRSTSPVAALTITNGGTGYSATPKVVIAPPTGGTLNATQATATATVTAGSITSISITNYGSGYITAPSVTITDATGVNAQITSSINPVWVTQAGQEIYQFSDALAVLQSQNTGIDAIYGIQSIATSWGSFKPIIPQVAFTTMQAYFRSIVTGATNTPSYWAQYGQGTLGSVYLYPIPSQVLPMEWDCYCVPTDLVNATDVDPLPDPWTDCVIYYAAYRAYTAAQRQQDAATMLAEYKRKIVEARVDTTPAQAGSLYG